MQIGANTYNINPATALSLVYSLAPTMQLTVTASGMTAGQSGYMYWTNSGNSLTFDCTVYGGWLFRRDLDPASNENLPAFIAEAA